MAVKVELLPSYSLGRYFQLAALALSRQEPVGESLIFDDARSYARLVGSVLERISELKIGESIAVLPGRVCEIVSKLCERVPEPRFMYNFSVDSDLARKLKAREVGGCEISANSVCHLAALYVDRLMSGGVVGGRVKLPMLLRSTIFGKTRGPHMVEVEEAQVDSVGLALLGALASYLGAVRVDESRYEYYVLPDGSWGSFKYYAPIVEILSGVLGEASYSVPEVSRTLASAGGLSIDLATYLAAIVNLLRSTETAERALGLAGPRAFETTVALRLEAGGNRPQVVWAGSLAVSDALLELRRRGFETAVARLYRLALRVERARARRAVGSERAAAERAAAVVTACVNSVAAATLATVAESAKASALLDCARGLASLLDAGDVPEDLRALARTLLESMK